MGGTDITNNVIICNSSGERIDISNNANFYLKVNSDVTSLTVGVTVTATGKTTNYYVEGNLYYWSYNGGTCVSDKGNAYSAGKPACQTLAQLEQKSTDSTIPLEQKINWQVSIPKGKLKIQKKDADTNELIKDAEVKITGPDNYEKTVTLSTGEKEVSNLLPGKYTITETKAPTGYNLSLQTTSESVIEVKNQQVNDGHTTEVTLKNKKYGDLRILKVDEDTGNPLVKVKFKIYIKDKNGKIEYLDRSSYKSGKPSTISTIKASQLNEKNKNDILFETNSNGEIVLTNLPIDTYYIVEDSMPDDLKDYYDVDTTTKELTLITNAQTRAYYLERTTKRIFIRTDVKKATKDLSQVNFTKAMYKAITNDTINDSTAKNIIKKATGATNGLKKDGDYYDEDLIKKVIHQIFVDYEGTISTRISKIFDNDSDNQKKLNYVKGCFDAVGLTNVQDTIKRQYMCELTKDTVYRKTNKRKYVDLSGYVWLDIVLNDGKIQGGGNGLYKTGTGDINDQLLKGISVQLKEKKDNKESLIQQKYTDEQGKYLFKKVEIDKLSNYYIEFSYNGMSYQSVTPQIGKSNGSKAAEGDNRTNFNNAYQTITYGKSNQYNLTYKTSGYESELLYRSDKDESKYNYGYSGNAADRGPVNGVDAQYMITADTYKGYGDKYLGEISGMKPDDIRKNSKTEIGNLNLGIEKREQPDLALVKDINSVKVGINGQTYTYKYGERFNKDLYKEGENAYSPQVKYGTTTKSGTLSYTRALYASDIAYSGSDKLTVKVTYQIGINNSTSLISVVNELEDYYNSKYYADKDKIKVGTKIEDNGDIKKGTELPYEVAASSGYEDYTKIVINTQKLEVKQGEDQYVYVQLEVKPENIADVLNENNGVDLDNYAEITSYSTKDQNGKVYAGIDQDSQPGNLKIKDTTTYEDDNDKAPGLKLVLQEERKIDGTVFIDSTTGELKTGEIRQGDGIFNEGEVGVKGVTVQLIDGETGEVIDKYNETTEKWEKASTTTDDDGNFEIAGFIPDDYKIVYRWGGQTYIDQNNEKQLIRVQDYKGTIYQEEKRQYDLEWYKETAPRYSDAMDNWDDNDVMDKWNNTREKIDSQMKTTTYAIESAIEEYSGTIKTDNGEEELITQMDSITPIFRVNIEYETDTNKYNTGEEYISEDGKIKMNGKYAKKQEAYKNYLQNVDFGIVERARQVLKLDKEIQHVKITRADGTVLVDANIENGKLKDTVKHTVYLPESPEANGQIKVELDNEIIQSAKLEIEYGLTVTNISEVDYVNEEYYKYGKGNGETEQEIVTLDPTKVIDYLDNNIAVTTEQVDELGEIKQSQTDKNNLIEDGFLAKETQTLLNETTRVLLINKEQQLNKKLKPDAQAKVELIVTKLLDTTMNEDNMTFNNSAGIIEVTKPGGASLITIPGESEPASASIDSDISETVLIVPPTGLNVDYIAYIILAISSLGILISGIILIKKFVLR